MLERLSLSQTKHSGHKWSCHLLLVHLYLKGKWEDEENLGLKGVLRVDISRNAPNLQKVTMMVQV
jgi:hypothetical protein